MQIVLQCKEEKEVCHIVQKEELQKKSGRRPLKNKENENPHEMKPRKKKNNNTKTT
ncbi:23248_t:CDS:2 [Gigaspora margarita]|uniref:23248_t:CDS:1 n=1 Tax=Gigaspora margarita TaxID=4874 RepID=A0ABN7UTN6_GIGMA|nr:23248_t:CDS:2 [Gigaspora margarita]